MNSNQGKQYTKPQREAHKKDLYSVMNSLSKVNSREEILNNYKWYSLASGIRNYELTLELMKEIYREGGTH